MPEEPRLYNTVAPLRNVAALLTLIERVKSRAHGLPGMATFYGPSGYGKTTAATYATNRFRACHIQVQALWRAKTLLQEIVIELGQRPARTAPEMFNQAAEELARSGRPLLLDEADHLAKDTMIEVVRGLYEASGVPVILIGEELLPQKLMRWERVHGRMLDWVASEPACLDDVRHLAPIYAPGIEIADDLRDHLLVASRRSIRRVAVNLAMVSEFARVRNLTRMARADWKGSFFTGEAPAPRREEMAEERRGTAVAGHARRRAV